MQNTKDILILRAYRPFLTFLTVFKFDNFRNIDNNRDNLLRNILCTIGVSLLMLNYNCPFLATELWVFIQSNFDLKTGGVQFSYFICGCPTIAVHLLLIWKSNNIIDTLDYLCGVVMERKCTCVLVVRLRVSSK